LKKRNYEDEYRVIADLTDFENLRSMMEVEAFRRRKTIKEEKKKKKLYVDLSLCFLFCL
jgi:hypothetical protein